ncbi:MAG: M15 family metallopeptidase [Prevotellaceae bacterium]|nr:M15 family metallopeptidase [Prevotellaceae bacterium]
MNKLSKSTVAGMVFFFCLSLVSCCNVGDKCSKTEASKAKDTPLEASIRKMGLVDIQDVDSAIAVHLVYATPYNFMGRQLYYDLNKAFMQPELAKKVSEARKLLKSIRPDLNLLVYDAARPIRIQHNMWNMVKDTDMRDFVSDPNVGQGMHNYGAAVDLTLMDCTGEPLPMGSEYDYFGDEARTNIEDKLLADGRITKRELENRLLLRRVMTEVGLLVFEAEWWHFNLMTPEEAAKKLKVVE